MAYSRTNENVAIQRLENEHGKKVTPSGLFIDIQYGFLGASPDEKVVGENSIVKVQCIPSIARSEEKNLVKIAETKKGFPLENEYGVLVINKRHNYYYQIQGQLCITRSEKCYFINFVDVFTPMVVLEIMPDQAFINDEIPKLDTFIIVVSYRRSSYGEYPPKSSTWIPQNEL